MSYPVIVTGMEWSQGSWLGSNCTSVWWTRQVTIDSQTGAVLADSKMPYALNTTTIPPEQAGAPSLPSGWDGGGLSTAPQWDGQHFYMGTSQGWSSYNHNAWSGIDKLTSDLQFVDRLHGSAAQGKDSPWPNPQEDEASSYWTHESWLVKPYDLRAISLWNNKFYLASNRIYYGALIEMQQDGTITGSWGGSHQNALTKFSPPLSYATANTVNVDGIGAVYRGCMISDDLWVFSLVGSPNTLYYYNKTLGGDPVRCLDRGTYAMNYWEAAFDPGAMRLYAAGGFSGIDVYDVSISGGVPSFTYNTEIPTTLDGSTGWQVHFLSVEAQGRWLWVTTYNATTPGNGQQDVYVWKIDKTTYQGGNAPFSTIRLSALDADSFGVSTIGGQAQWNYGALGICPGGAEVGHPPLRHKNRDDGLANSMARKGPKGPTSSQLSARRGPRAYS